MLERLQSNKYKSGGFSGNQSPCPSHMCVLGVGFKVKIQDKIRMTTEGGVV